MNADESGLMLMKADEIICSATCISDEIFTLNRKQNNEFVLAWKSFYQELINLFWLLSGES